MGPQGVRILEYTRIHPNSTVFDFYKAIWGKIYIRDDAHRHQVDEAIRKVKKQLNKAVPSISMNIAFEYPDVIRKANIA